VPEEHIRQPILIDARHTSPEARRGHEMTQGHPRYPHPGKTVYRARERARANLSGLSRVSTSAERLELKGFQELASVHGLGRAVPARRNRANRI
jgi:hypothetical protein